MDNNGFLKDSLTGVIYNTNDNEYKAAMQARERVKKEKQLQQQVNHLVDELTEIKTLLSSLIRKNNG